MNDNYFTIQELIRSSTATRLGIDNTPSQELINHAYKFLIPGLNQIRILLGKPVVVDSGFRCEKLNSATPGSSSVSQHCKFEAADIVCPSFGNPLAVAKAIINNKDIKFDQLIYEYGEWVHVSFSGNPKRDIRSKWTGTSYLRGLVNKDNKSL